MLNRSLGRNALQLEYSPGQNCSGILEFNGAQIFLQRYSDGQAVTVGYDHQYMQPEVMSLRTWGQDASVLKEFLAAAVVTTEEDKGAEINIMCISDGWPGGWQKAVTKKVPTDPLVLLLELGLTYHPYLPQVRSLDSVVLEGSSDDNLQQKLLNDAKQFQSRAEWYL